MALQNRVTPLGDLIATAERGLLYGNRGCLHDKARLIRRRYSGKRWIACRLRFRGRRRSPLMQPGRYTELFFLDEVTAMAAGHRPCAECRREDYNRFVSIWRERGLGASGPDDPVGADAIDARLHLERVDPATRGHRLHEYSLGSLPDGAFVLRDGVPWLVLSDRLLRWSAGGYREAVPRHGGSALVITPPSLVEVLSSGWRPLLHPSATA